jgi:hypothetical protein
MRYFLLFFIFISNISFASNYYVSLLGSASKSDTMPDRKAKMPIIPFSDISPENARATAKIINVSPVSEKTPSTYEAEVEIIDVIGFGHSFHGRLWPGRKVTCIFHVQKPPASTPKSPADWHTGDRFQADFVGGESLVPEKEFKLIATRIKQLP